MKLENISGIGPKTVKILNKLDINNIIDLLTYYPYRYNFINIKNINDAIENETIYIKVSIASVPKVNYIRKNFNFLTFSVLSNSNVINVKIYNRAFMKNNLRVGKEIVLIGKYDRVKNLFTASDIKFNITNNTIEPIYHLTEGITNNSLRKYIYNSLDYKKELLDLVPSYYNEKYNFINKDKAVEYIHNPKSSEQIKLAKLKLIYEELFEYTFKINCLKQKNKNTIGINHVFNKEDIDIFLNSLAFKLTEDQLKAIDEIIKDLSSNNRMNRLVLGDVGSGKTIVAIVAILANYYSGYQSAFMAPTEILANQHYDVLNSYFNDLGIKVELLTGSKTKKQKEGIYQKIKDNKIDVVVGTHSIINDSLEFKKLGLVIIDEQHLFGVKQRNSLQEKGNNLPDVLYLSATPIPRTYALTIYGDLNLSLIKSKPHMRKSVITKVKKESEIKDVLFAMLEEIKLGHQVFVVSPLIEDNNESTLNNVKDLKNKLNMAFNNKLNIEIIHGKMKQSLKDAIMSDFQNGVINVLISTTVIEVGIDIPNATMMVIYNAERFGLAALHQLRGRVGRNDLQSYCYLISNYDNDRLSVMESSTDGFYIAEKDFEQRGHGDLFGIRQSGDITFKIANIKENSQILLQANKDSEEYLNSDKYLDSNYYKSVKDKINFLD